MIKSLLFISVAPVIIIALYIYIRDKYEKEPIVCLLKALISGILIVFPIVLLEKFLYSFFQGGSEVLKAAFNAFVVASFPEEGFKYFVFILLFWGNRNFNEKFDGIVYAVFISLGFAAIENMLYVFREGYDIGYVRALTAVPAHALFGTVMGYHLGIARFYPYKRKNHLMLAFAMPFMWHGIYDFLLMGQRPILLVIFIPVLIYFWINGFNKIKQLSQASIYRNDVLIGKKTDHSEGEGSVI
jgi:RsiW-degrading membrane proteinase PrsW (M82 family)